MKNKKRNKDTLECVRKSGISKVIQRVSATRQSIAQNNRSFIRNYIIVFTIFIVFVMAYYILFPSGAFMHADSVDTLMWAQASYDAGALFNPDFTYAALFPFGGQLLMLPLIAIFGVTMKAQIIGMLLFFILFVLSLLFMLKQLNWGPGWSCLAVTCMLLVLSASEKLREIFWGHIIYYSLGIFFMLVGLGLIFKAWNALKDDGTKRDFITCVTGIFIWFTLTATNQMEALTLFIVPAIGALICERFFTFKGTLTQKEKKGNFIIIIATILAAALGCVLGNILKNGMVAGYATAYSNFSSPDDWFKHLSLFLSHWTTLLGFNAAEGDPIFSADGIMNLLRIIVSLILIVAPIAATLLFSRIKDRGFRLIILYHWIMTTLIMMGYVFGALSAANWRLSPIVGTAVLVTIMLCRWIYKATEVKRLVLIMMIPILMVGMGTIQAIFNMPANYKHHPLLSSVSSTLKENDLTYGYATFWNANVLTVLSNSEAKVRNINLDETTYSRSLYQSQGKWYDDQPGQESYFVLASTHEYNLMNKSNHQLIIKAKKTIPLEGYYILVYDENIF